MIIHPKYFKLILWVTYFVLLTLCNHLKASQYLLQDHLIHCFSFLKCHETQFTSDAHQFILQTNAFIYLSKLFVSHFGILKANLFWHCKFLFKDSGFYTVFFLWITFLMTIRMELLMFKKSDYFKSTPFVSINSLHTRD